MKRIAVVGVDGERVAPGAEPLLEHATLVAGGRRHLDALAPPAAQRVPLTGALDEALDAIAAHDGAVCVLASGDPGFFGIVRALAARFGSEGLDVRPAASSVAVAFARLGVPWDDAIVVSAHGREPSAALAVALRHPKVAILTSPDAPPGWFAQRLAGSGRRVVVAERLGTADERVVDAEPGGTYAEPNVVLVLDDVAPTERARMWPPRATEAGWALPDDAFEHRARMVTKAEVRALALARLGPGVGDLVWDVGCHSGSVAIECARIGAAAIAIDRDPEAIELTARNAERYRVPVRVVHGEAPAALADLPDPDAVFVGGGGAGLEAILDACIPRVRRVIVVTLALIERAAPALERLRAAGLEADATMLQASRFRPLAGGHRLAAENPVVVVWGRRT